jgi:hypothetical protein
MNGLWKIAIVSGLALGIIGCSKDSPTSLSSNPSSVAQFDVNGPQGEVATALNDNGTAIVFARGNDNNLYYRQQTTAPNTQYPNGVWPSTWTSLGGPIIGNIATGKQPDGKVFVFSRATDNGIIYRRQSSAGSTTWNDWVAISIGSQNPSRGRIVVANLIGAGGGNLEVYTIYPGGHLHYWVQINRNGNDFWGFGTMIGSDIVRDNFSVVQNANYMYLFAINSIDSTILCYRSTPSGSWAASSSVILPGKKAYSNISAACNQDGRCEVFIDDIDAYTWHNWQTSVDGSWSGWGNLIYSPWGGVCFQVAVNADGRLELITSSAYCAIMHLWQVVPNGGWAANQPFAFNSNMTMELYNPGVGKFSDGRLIVLMKSRLNNSDPFKIWYCNQAVAGGWTDWTAFSNN